MKISAYTMRAQILFLLILILVEFPLLANKIEKKVTEKISDDFNKPQPNESEGASMGKMPDTSSRKLHDITLKNANNVVLGKITLDGHFVNKESWAHLNKEGDLRHQEQAGPHNRVVISTFDSLSVYLFIDPKAEEGDKVAITEITNGLKKHNGLVTHRMSLTPEDSNFQIEFTKYLKAKYNLKAVFKSED